MRLIRQSIRSLLLKPAYATTAVLTLALGMGLTTAIFSVIYAILLRPLPFPDPDSLTRVYPVKNGRGTFSPPNFFDLRGEAASFESMAAWYDSTYTIVDSSGDAEKLEGAATTPEFFEVLGVTPVLGRRFTAADAVSSAEGAVILSYGVWQRRYQSSREVIGKVVRIEGSPMTVVGIAPPGFDYPGDADVWVPLGFTSEELATQRGAQYLDVVARLKDSNAIQKANTEVRTIAARLEKAWPEKNSGWTYEVVTLQEATIGQVRRPLLTMLAASLLVLLIALVNVANLSLSRALMRARDLAIRTAIGATRRRIARELLLETSILGIAGCLAGLLLAALGTQLLVSLAPESIPRFQEVGLHLPVLLFAASTLLLSVLVIGPVAAIQINSADLAERLRQTSRGGGEPLRTRQLRSLLVAAEVALAVMLLTAAGLLLKSFVRLQDVELGFSSENILTFSTSMPDAKYPEPANAAAAVRELRERFNATPGVEKAAAIFGLPLGFPNYSFSPHQVDNVPPADEFLSIATRVITPDYFSVMGIPLLAGRAFTDRDDASQPGKVVVSESAARLLWPGQNPIGHSVILGTRLGGMKDRIGGEVIGVVRDIRDRGALAQPMAAIYVHHPNSSVDFLTWTIRTRGNPADVVPAVRAALRDFDAEMPMFQTRTMEEITARSLAPSKFYATLVLLFAGVAVLLAAIGIYGVIAFAVSQQTREIGVRLALGAKPADILQNILRGGLVLTLVGVVIGLGAAAGMLRLIESLLFQLPAVDPPVYAGVAVILSVVAAFAIFVPARRASRVDPIVALRFE